MCIRIVLLLMLEPSDDRTMWSFFYVVKRFGLVSACAEICLRAIAEATPRSCENCTFAVSN